MPDGIKMTGHKKLEKALKKFGKDAGAQIEGSLHAGGQIVEDNAADRAARLTGDLAESMATETMEQGKNSTIVGVGPDNEIFYSLFVELGTTTHDVERVQAQGLQIGADLFRASASGIDVPAQPFLRPALDSNETRVIEKIGQDLAKRLGLK